MNPTTLMPEKIKPVFASSPATRRKNPFEAGFWCGAFDPATDQLLTGMTDGRILCFDHPNYEMPAATIEGHTSYVTYIAVDDARRRVLSVGYDRRVICRECETKNIDWEIKLDSAPLAVAYCSASGQFAVIHDNTKVAFHDATDGKRLHVFDDGHPLQTRQKKFNVLSSLAISPDGKLLASGDFFGHVVIREADTGKILHTIDAKLYRYSIGYETDHGGTRSLLFSPDSRMLFAGGTGSGSEKTMHLVVAYDPQTGRELFRKNLSREASGQPGSVHSLAWHDSGWIFAGLTPSANQDQGSIHALDTNNLEEILEHTVDNVIASRALILPPSGSHLIATGWSRKVIDGGIKVWSLA